MISEVAWTKFWTSIELIPFAPDSRHYGPLAEALEEFVSSDEQLIWLGMRMVSIYSKFPPVPEIRACFSSRFKPKDGRSGYSEVFAGGVIPPESRARIAARELKELPPGHMVTADKRADAAMKIALAAQKAKDASFTAPATAQEIAAAPEWLRQLQKQFE